MAVERGDFKRALDSLNRAIELNPHYGHAYNEMAYVQGKAGYLDAARESALNAIDCDPGNPKFVNTLVGIEIDRAKRTTTAEERRAHGEKLLQVIEAKLHQNPEYPGLWLSKAEALAMAGRPTAEWEEALSGAEKCYRIRGTTAGGVKISDLSEEQTRNLIERHREQCRAYQATRVITSRETRQGNRIDVPPGPRQAARDDSPPGQPLAQSLRAAFGEYTKQVVFCSICKRRMTVLQASEASGVIIVGGSDASRQQGCFRCAQCGRYTCYDCSDRDKVCECGANTWEEASYLM